MSLLFDGQRCTQDVFSIKVVPEKEGVDTVLLSKKLWDTLAHSSHPSLLPICIEPVRKNHSRGYGLTSSIICWAALDESIEHLAIPSKWSKIYRHIFTSELEQSLPSLSITTTDPVLLTEVIVTALSADAYRIACTQNSILEDWLCDVNVVLRHGDIYTFSGDQIPLEDSSSLVSYAYRLDMVEPVLQGFARKSLTKFVVILSEQGEHSASPAFDDATEGDYEINEAFLAKISRFPVFEQHHHAHSTSSETDSNDTPNGGELPSDCFRLIALSEPVDSVADHCTLYVRTADLGRIGILDGDWAMARPYGASYCRMVRLRARDVSSPTMGTAIGSPTLLQNLLASVSRTTNLISFYPSPFGSRGPVIPSANAITIARVASPLSLNRLYQPLFLKSLKRYFESAKQLVKQGDIIAVTLDTDDILYCHKNRDNDEGINDNDQYYKLSAFPPQPNELVFFYITSVEHDVVKSDLSPDIYVGCTTGELGCWVDPLVTRIVQTGVEQSWVPDVGTYFDSVPITIPRALYSMSGAKEPSYLLGPGSAFEKLMKFISAACAQKAMDYKLDLSVLLKGARGTGKFTTICWVAQRLGIHLLEVNCYHLVGESDTKIEGTLRARFDKAKQCSPCIILLRHVDALAQTTQAQEPGKEPTIFNALRECVDDIHKEWKVSGYPVITLATSSEPGRMSTSLISSFKHEIFFQAPGEGERNEILQCLLASQLLATDVSVSNLATQTAALVASDLADLVVRAKRISLERVIRSSTSHPSHLVQAGIALTAADFDTALAKSRASYSESIGAPKIPNVTWDDVGGLAQVKADILDTIQLPLEHPELFSDGLKKRSGILLYGPPGTGKTLLAKAVATSCSLNFFSVKGPELLNMYIGESEANVRRVFQRARDAKPCVIFFDELDSIAPKRGNQGDSGGVMDRIVSQLLAELDGMSSKGGTGNDVFVIGATNRPDLLDPALLRPGRFDRALYLGVSETHEAQTKILEALTRKFQLMPGINLHKVAQQCPFNYTGADFYALCSDAMLNAMSRQAKIIDDKIACLNSATGPNSYPIPLTAQHFLAEMASADDLYVLVSQEDFEHALRSLIPSVTQAEMNHYSQIQRRFSQIES